MAIKTVRNKGKETGPPKLEKHVTVLTCPECEMRDIPASQFAVQLHVRQKHRDLEMPQRHELERRLYPAMGEQLKKNLIRDALQRRANR